MLPSRLPLVLDALVDLCTAATTPGAPLEGVRILDGPPATELADRRVLALGDDDQSATAATAQQEWATLGRGAKDESGFITCTAYARAGDTDLRARRAEVFALMAALETLLRPGQPDTDPTLGGLVLWTAVGGQITYRQEQQGGSLAVLTFEVAYRARI